MEDPSSTAAETTQTSRYRSVGPYNFLGVLSQDEYGKVMLAATETPHRLYAVKILDKEQHHENAELDNILMEKRVFLRANHARHPFLMTLHSCFQTDASIYFVMEHTGGGRDLMTHIQRSPFGLQRSQLYAAEICLALKWLHEQGILYRNLQLSSCLLMPDGHIKLVDYGLCKENMWHDDRTDSFCGTAEFLAPEIILDQEYGRAVDWWAFGVVLYQMLLGQAPFRGEDEDEIYDAILASDIVFSVDLPEEWVAVLEALLERDPEGRLGSGRTDAREVMSQACFEGIVWEDVYHKRVRRSFVPRITSEMDRPNLEPESGSSSPMSESSESLLPQHVQDQFRDFDFTAEFA